MTLEILTFYSLNKVSKLYDGLDSMFAAESDEEKKIVSQKSSPLNKQPKADVGDEVERKRGIVVEDAKLKLVKEEISKDVKSSIFIAASGVLLKTKASGPDILVVADPGELSKLKRAIEVLEKKLNKSLSFVLIEPEDYAYRSKINDRFLTAFLKSKHEILFSKLEN